MTRKYGTGDRTVNLRGPHGNAWSLLGLAKNLIRQLNPYNPERYNDSILDEMKAGDYENLLEVFELYFGDYFTLYFPHEDEY